MSPFGRVLAALMVSLLIACGSTSSPASGGTTDLGADVGPRFNFSETDDAAAPAPGEPEDPAVSGADAGAPGSEATPPAPPITSPEPERVVGPAERGVRPRCGDGRRAAFEYCLRGGPPPVPMEHVDCMAAADVDGDGRAELAVCDREAGRVRLLWGAAPAPWRVPLVDQAPSDGAEPYRAFLLDIDGDEHTDLVVTTMGSEPMVLLGDGEGVFHEPETPLLQSSYNFRSWRRMELGDADGDGVADLYGFRDAYRDASWGHAVIARGDPEGGFGAPELIADAREAAFADLDHDGDLDLVLEDRSGSIMRVAVQDSAVAEGEDFVISEGPPGSSGAPVLWRPPTRRSARVLASGRDVLLDVEIRVPDGVVDVRPVASTDSLGVRPWFVRGVDADGDGRMDAAVALTRRSAFAVLIAREDTPVGAVLYGDAGPTRDAVTFADVEGDGLPDAIFWSRIEGALRVSPLHPEGLARHAPGLLPSDISADQVMGGDFDGDGLDDLAGALAGAPLRMLLSDGSGGVRRRVDVPLSGLAVTGIDTADVDGDGRTEIIAVGTQRRAVVALAADGKPRVDVDILVHGAYAVAVADAPDATGDGVADLFITDTRDGVHLYAGDGSGGFTRVWTGIHGGDGASVRAGDFDGDGTSGCVVFGRYPKTLTGAFEFRGGVGPEAPVAVSLTTRHVEVGDVDGDGRDDIVGGSGGGNAAVAFARADGGFHVIQRDGDPADEQSGLAVFDVDGDGTAEIVVPDRGVLRVLSATFDATVDLATVPHTVQEAHKPGRQRRLVPADIDGDGALDLWSVRSGHLVHGILNGP